MYFIPGLAHSYSHSGQDIEAPNIFTQSRLFLKAGLGKSSIKKRMMENSITWSDPPILPKIMENFEIY